MGRQHDLARYISVVRLFESLGGSESYEKDPTSYSNALKKQLTDYIPEDDEVAVRLFKLLDGPIELEGGHKVTMAGLLCGVELLGGSKSFEEHVRKLATPELQVNQVGVTTPHGLKKPDNVKDSAGSGPHVIEAYAYSNYAHMSSWTAIFYVSIQITADIDGTTYIMNGSSWGIGWSFSAYEAGQLNYNKAPAGNPDLSGNVAVSMGGAILGVGVLVVTTYKNDRDYANFVGIAGASTGLEKTVVKGSGIWTHD